MPTNNAQPQGPDPEVQEAIGRLHQTQLSPLEEVMFNSWASANGIDPEKHDSQFDLRDVYKQTGGQVMPPGQLKDAAQKASDMQTLAQAQQAHENASPMQMFQSYQKPAGLAEELMSRQSG
jgi:hypothetical protein